MEKRHRVGALGKRARPSGSRQSRRAQKSALAVERLESRRLLATDLTIQLTQPPQATERGDVVEFRLDFPAPFHNVIPAFDAFDFWGRVSLDFPDELIDINLSYWSEFGSEDEIGGTATNPSPPFGFVKPPINNDFLNGFVHQWSGAVSHDFSRIAPLYLAAFGTYHVQARVADWAGDSIAIPTSVSVFVADITLADGSAPTLATGATVVQIPVLGQRTTDLEVEIDQNLQHLQPGSPFARTIVVDNQGPHSAMGATFHLQVPEHIENFTWERIDTRPRVLPENVDELRENGTGAIAHSLDLRSGESISYTIRGQVSESIIGSIETIVSIDVDGNAIDANLHNNADSTVDVVITQPSVEQIVINDGQQSRSHLESVTVMFNAEVDPTLLPSAFVVTHQATRSTIDGFHVDVAVVDGKSQARLTFGGSTSGTGLQSLDDGRYELTIRAQRVRLGSTRLNRDHHFGQQATDKFFRRFGDADGDGDIDALNRVQFAQTFMKSAGDPRFNPDFDFDGDGDVDARDYAAFARGQRQNPWRSSPAIP